ncbi:MAG TPA: prepilin peptidase [bacterium]|nr:prepilin peptidase [bacterium]
MSIVFPNSFCPKCEKAIKWYDNIPLFSYLALSGKCRFCSVKIPIKYPIVEFITALLFIIFFLKFGLEKTYFFYIILTGYLIVLTFIDIDKKEVPDSIIVFLFLTGFVFGIFEIKEYLNIYTGLIAGLAGGFVIYLINFFSNGKIGEGDIKLIAALGLCVGLKDIGLIVFGSFVIGGIAAAILLLLKKKGRRDELAFVPFITAAFLLVVLLK